ncbi:MAG: hypothetical protein ACI4WG_04800 [Erysipelotrichaceae bacterium]
MQDLSEKVSRSNEVQMHLCCITHKSLSSYYRNRKSEIANSLKTVEGRFREIRFNRSLNQNYEIISLTLEKLPGFDEVFEREKENNKELYEMSKELFGQTSEDVIFKGCFPLNPLATYSAIQVSEMVAQNERTLFTLISDADPNSLASFIRRNDKGIYNVDQIYDYFSSILEKSESEDVRSLNYKTQTSLLKVDDDVSISIIKALSIIRLINNFDGFPSSEEVISKSINRDRQNVKLVLNDLVEKRILKKMLSNGCYDFVMSGSKEIDDQINSILSVSGKKIDIISVLNDLYPSFELPRKYNAKNKMTRFYKQMYISATTLNELTSFKSYFTLYSCDGFVFKVVMIDDITFDVDEKFREIDEHERVVLKVPKKKLTKNIIDEIFRLSALKQLLTSKNLTEEDREEIRIIIEDETYELGNVLDEIFSNECVDIISIVNGGSYIDAISSVFETIYYSSPIVNNEMINKNSPVSVQYSKPRDYVVDLYLNNQTGKIKEKSDTGPEATVFNSVDPFERNTKLVIELIKKSIERSENEQVVFSEIYELLKRPPYGVRKGVLPVLFAIAINQIDAHLIVRFGKKEIPLSAEIIDKMVEKPEKYSFTLAKGTKEKGDYLKGLAEIFNVELSDIFAKDITLISEAIKRLVFGMPKIARNCTKKDNYLSLSEDILMVKDVFYSFDINPYETLFKKLPSIYGNSYKETINKMKTVKDRLDSSIGDFEVSLANEIKFVFNADSKASLYNVFADYISETSAKNRYLEDEEKAVVAVFDEKIFDDSLCLNEISQVMFSTKITDWERNLQEDLLGKIKKFKESIPKRSIIVDNKIDTVSYGKELSKMGNLLKNQILDAFEEFNDSVSNEEKAQILTQIFLKITK